MVPLMGFLGPEANAGQNRAGRQLEGLIAVKMPETEAESRAQSHRVERKLAAPVVCTDCQWLGKVGSLRSFELRCPMCGGARIKWIENEAPKLSQ